MGTRSDLGGGLLGCRLCYSSDETFLSLPPVDDLHHLGKVLGASIFVVEVVSMLPDVHVDDRHQIGAHVRKQLLVMGNSERECVLSFVVHKPSPTRALDGSSSLVKDFDELINTAPAFDDGCVERTLIRESAIRWWTERLPEEFVV